MPAMLCYTEELAELDRRYARESLAGLTYQEALARFTALWAYARKLNPDFPADWERDIQPDLVLARVLNGLPVER
jgi:hypothetical protein